MTRRRGLLVLGTALVILLTLGLQIRMASRHDETLNNSEERDKTFVSRNLVANRKEPIMNGQYDITSAIEKERLMWVLSNIHSPQASGRIPSMKYTYRPIEALPYPRLLESVELDPVADVFGEEWFSLEECIHLTVNICGDRTEEALVMLKSAALATEACIVLHIFAEDELQARIRHLLNAWPKSLRRGIHASYIYPITYPSAVNSGEWRKLSQLCGTQRLFLPNLLPKVDSVLYLDTDTIVVKPLDDIWNVFSRFNATQLAAATLDYALASLGWYNQFGRLPYYGKTGINSGVMLMNLTRMREFRWINRIIPLYELYKHNFDLGDQDILNVVFHFHPDRLYESPCTWHYRAAHCMYGNNCPNIDSEGIAAIHANQKLFHNDKQPPFRSIYEAYRDFTVDETYNLGDLAQSLMKKWSEHIDMHCTQALWEPVLSTLER